MRSERPDPPTAHGIDVWYQWTERLEAGDLDAFDTILSDEERARRDRFLFSRDRRDFSAAHALLRKALSTYGPLAPSEWRFAKNAHGKPRITTSQAGTPQLTFSLSHTHGLVACAVAHDTRLGIDVERCDRVVRADEIAEAHFARQELEALRRCPPEEYRMRFVEFWTLKEAYVKALGTGLTDNLHEFAFHLNDASRVHFTPGDGDGRWRFWLAALGDARLAVAASTDDAYCGGRMTFRRVGSGADPDASILRVSELPFEP